MFAVLSNEFLSQLTGYVRPTDVAKCLRQHKIFYIEGKDGQITTTEKWIEQAGHEFVGANDDFNPNF